MKLGDRLREEAQWARSNEDLVRRFVDALPCSKTVVDRLGDDDLGLVAVDAAGGELPGASERVDIEAALPPRGQGGRNRLRRPVDLDRVVNQTLKHPSTKRRALRDARVRYIFPSCNNREDYRLLVGVSRPLRRGPSTSRTGRVACRGGGDGAHRRLADQGGGEMSARACSRSGADFDI